MDRDAMDPIATIREQHRIISSYQCRCGWEGDSVFTHVVDTLGLEQVGFDNPPTWPEPWVRLTGVSPATKATPVYRIRGGDAQ